MGCAHQNLNSSCDLTRPLSRTAYHPQASNCYRQSTYQILSLSPRTTKIWKATQNVKNGVIWRSYGHPRSLEIVPFDRAHIYEFLLAFHSNYVPILHCFWDTARYLSKSADVNLSDLYLAPPLGVMLSEFRQYFWHRKSRVPGLSYGGARVILGLAIFVQLLTCDRRTDRPTDTW